VLEWGDLSLRTGLLPAGGEEGVELLFDDQNLTSPPRAAEAIVW
jgi:hypothetical protein